MYNKTVLFHILAKDKENVLPYWLEQNLDNTTYPKENIVLYFRTNNNTDNTKNIIISWIVQQKINKVNWKDIIYDSLDVPEKVEQYGIHEWNSLRFSVIAKLRQKGIEKAIELDVDFYFVCDVDNFLIPDTISKLVDSNLPVIAPLLKYAYCEEDKDLNIYANPYYSNFHHPVSENGYFVDSLIYYEILNRINPSLHAVDLVHCTYLIRKDILNKISYFDDTNEFEYIIFSRNLRAKNITQVLDTRIIYGCLTITENANACKNYMNTLL
jgi:hypothetical protein